MDVISYKKAKHAEELAQGIIDGSIGTGVLQTKIDERLAALEAQYAPDLAGVKTSLADMANLLKINIKDKQFGAIGDGNSHPISENFTTLPLAQMKYPHATSLTDEIDWCAIQAAINSTNSYASIYFPAGVYIISAPIFIKNFQYYHGDGWQTIIKRKNNTNLSFMLDVSNPNTPIYQMNIKDLMFDGNKDNQTATGNGLYLRGIINSVLKNVKVINCKGTGFWFDKNANGNGSSNSHLVDCWTFNNDGYGVYSSEFCLDIHIFGGDHGSNMYAGIFIKSPSSSIRNGAIVWGTRQGHGVQIDFFAPSVQLMGITVEGNDKHGIYVMSDHVYISGCKVYANSNEQNSLYDGIVVEGTTSDLVKNTMIDANTIYSTLVGTATGGTQRYQINLINHQDTSIFSNSLMYNGLGGVIDTTKLHVKGINDSTKTDLSWFNSYFYANLSSVQTIPSATWTTLNFDTLQQDNGSEFNNTSKRFTPKYTGLYQFDVEVLLNNTTANNSIMLSLFKNGIEYRLDGRKSSSSTGSFQTLRGSVTIPVSPSDYIEVHIYSDNQETTLSGASYTRFTGRLIK